jgi:hypothetical protein
MKNNFVVTEERDGMPSLDINYHRASALQLYCQTVIDDFFLFVAMKDF